jgi:hypothetical protein
VLVELGTLDITNNSGYTAVSKILIEKVTIIVTDVSATALVGSLQLSTTIGTATNSPVAAGTEIIGFNATYLDTFSGAEADINFATLTVIQYVPRSSVASTTALNADATTGRFTVVVEYLKINIRNLKMINESYHF